MDGGVSTDFKSSNRIEICWLIQVLLNFYWFQGSPPMGLGGWGCGMEEGCTQHPCTCTYMHVHMTIWHHRESPGFPQIQWGQPFAIEIIMFNMYMCVHMHVHVCGGSPNNPIHPSHPPTPHSCREPKHQSSISLELIEIFWLCLKILYLWTLLNSYRL